MARKTKEAAQATRSRILDTAEQVFELHGVSGTSLHAIAKAAGLTRGAIYWHFSDKADLFNAMMDRATLPLEEAGAVRGLGRDISLREMRDALVAALRRIVTDPQMKRVFGIATHKVEYVGELTAVRDRHLRVRSTCMADLERTLREAARRGELKGPLNPRTAARGLHALLDGLLQNWMLDPTGFNLVKVGAPVIDAYLSGLVAPRPGQMPRGGRLSRSARPLSAAASPGCAVPAPDPPRSPARART
jgi:TetR/AcrR family acrAB operon transcriptional repressor